MKLMKFVFVLVAVITVFFNHNLRAAEDCEQQIFDELAECLLNQDTTMIQRVFRKYGYLQATADTMPALYGMVEHLATKANIRTPLVLVYIGNNAGLQKDAQAYSLWRNCGLICIGDNLLTSLTSNQLEAVIAHELCHITKNHLPKRILITLGFLPWLAVVFCMPEDYNVMLASYCRYCEIEADLGAIELIDDPNNFIKALEECAKLNGIRLSAERSHEFNPLGEYVRLHPQYTYRQKYIEALAD